MAASVCDVACYHPIPCWRTDAGSIVFSRKAAQVEGIFSELEVPCGQCIGCRLERSRQWAMRCLHEASLHRDNSFITLTYDDYHLPANLSLNYGDYQLFMKRLRKSLGGQKVRFYMAGEYGEEFGRPHFHACLFGHDFHDKKLFKKSANGSTLYTSAALEKLWPFGHSSVGEVNFESAAYVARYIMKKVTGDAAADHYRYVDPDGVVHERTPEFNRMSLKPGIGRAWLDKWECDVYPHDYTVINGKKVRPPKYYDKIFSEKDPYEFEFIKLQRELDSRTRVHDNTRERLAVREKVAKANLSRYSRQLT